MQLTSWGERESIKAILVRHSDFGGKEREVGDRVFETPARRKSRVASDLHAEENGGGGGGVEE